MRWPAVKALERTGGEALYSLLALVAVRRSAQCRYASKRRKLMPHEEHILFLGAWRDQLLQSFVPYEEEERGGGGGGGE